jgi:hypothetical protein
VAEAISAAGTACAEESQCARALVCIAPHASACVSLRHTAFFQGVRVCLDRVIAIREDRDPCACALEARPDSAKVWKR